ncbi:MAG TPA: endosialidase [Candidatus Merdenecus merdavium]|nr:endosialidase [Candidatus Merdenecus merdavium]
MSVVKELIRIEDNGTISFGNYELENKSKLEDFEFNGDLYKVKTFKEITKLEKNSLFVYESVPGTSVTNFNKTDMEVTFSVNGPEDAQVILELEEEKEYKVYTDDINIGTMKTNLGGKLVLSVELGNCNCEGVKVRIVKL